MGSLVLMRRPGEAVIIRDADGKPFGAIAVSSVKGNKVRIAFDVRRNCEIVRAEKALNVDVNQDGWNQGE